MIRIACYSGAAPRLVLNLFINKSYHQSLLTILRPALRYHFMTASSFNDCCKSRHAVSGELLLMLARSPQIASSLGSRAPLLATLLMLRLLIARPASTLRSSELMTTLRYPPVRYVSRRPPRKSCRRLSWTPSLDHAFLFN